MKHRGQEESGGRSSLSPSGHQRREEIAPLKKLKNTLLAADVLIDVSKIKIYAKENFDLELINNVNDRFVEKTYKLLVDTRKNKIPEDELNDFIFLLMNERKENSHLEKISRKGHDKSGSAKCPIKNEVTNLIKKMNKFHFYFKEFLKKDKLWMDVANRGDGKGNTWGTTRGTTLDNLEANTQSALQANSDKACRKVGTCLSYIQRKGETGKKGEVLYSHIKQRKEQREKTERAIRSLLNSCLSEKELDVERLVEMENMTGVDEEMHDSFGGPECVTKKLAPFSQRVKVQNVSPSPSDENKVRETEGAPPYRCDYVRRVGCTARGDIPHGCTFQKGCTNLVAGGNTHNKGRHKQTASRFGGIPHGYSIDDGDSSSGDDARHSEVMRRSQSDGTKYYLYKNPFSGDDHREFAHGASLTEYEMYVSRKKKKKKKKKKNYNKDNGNQKSDSLFFLQVPNVLSCEWKKHSGRSNRRKALGTNNVDNYLGDAYNSCENPRERNPMLGVGYEEALSSGTYLHEESNNLVHTVLGTKDQKREFLRKSGHAKGNTKGHIKGRGAKGHEDGGTSTTGKKGLTLPSEATSPAPIIPQEDYSKKGMLKKTGNNSPPEGEKRSDQLCRSDAEGQQLSELHRQGRDDINLNVPNAPWHLARSDEGNGVIGVSGGGSPLPSGTGTSASSNGNRMRKKGSSGGFLADGRIAKVKDNVLGPLSGETDTGKDEAEKGERNVGLKTNVSNEKGKKKNGKLRPALCEQMGGNIKVSPDGSLVVGGAPSQYDNTTAHFDEDLKMDGPNEWNSDIATEGGVNPLEDSNNANRDYMCSVLDLRPTQDDTPTGSAQDTNEWELFERKEATPLHHKGGRASNVRSGENYNVREKKVKKYEQDISNYTSSMDYSSGRQIYDSRNACSSVSQHGSSSNINREGNAFPDFASNLGGDNMHRYNSSDERFEDFDLDEGDRRTHPRGEDKYNFLEEDTWKGQNNVAMNQKGRGNTWRRNQGSIHGTHLGGDGRDTLHKHRGGFLQKGPPTYDRTLIRHIQRNDEFYEEISRDMEGVTRGVQNESFYGPPERYLHGPDSSPDGESVMSFNQKDFLLLKKKTREQDSRLNKWLHKIHARENEKKKKIQEKKNASIKQELVNCTFHPRVSSIQPNRVKSFIKEEGRKGGGVNIHTKGYMKLGPHIGKGEFDEDPHIVARGAHRRAARVKAITRVGSGTSPMYTYEDALMYENVIGRMSRNISVEDPHGMVVAREDARREYYTRGRYTDGKIPGEDEIHSDHQNSHGRSSGEELPYSESKIKHLDRNELLYWKAMKQKEHLQRKKDAFEEAKENKFKSECKFSPEIKENVKIYMSDLPKGYSKTVERIKRGVEEKRRVHNFLEYRIPVSTNGDKNAQNACRSKWQGGRTTTLSPFSFDKGFYKVKIKPVYFETKIKLSENKIASLAIREDEDPLYIIDIFCKIHAIKDEDRRILYEYVMDELRKASQGS
ncbi:hypothetical protein AK88_04503 [Plasmodium fragile]|uniref:Uncharacterized protein n=1 Tax=Plasmodium fragile TaxID=5857 RepID=A0A0D9QFM9_PLAFR|nr:uncharacterized protein AK88_04503 [Plasmodium fragile]KJP85855.1 hypothetical protein AK88_04503 [Plasmodium fragile]